MFKTILVKVRFLSIYISLQDTHTARVHIVAVHIRHCHKFALSRCILTILRLPYKLLPLYHEFRRLFFESFICHLIYYECSLIWCNAIQKPAMHASYLISCYCSNIDIFRSIFYSFLLHVYNLYFVIKKNMCQQTKSLLQTDYSFDILILTCIFMTNLDYCIKGYLWVFWINSLIGKYQLDRK